MVRSFPYLKMSLFPMNNLRPRKGFTVIEMLLYIGLSAFVIVILLQVVLDVLDNRTDTTESIDLQQEARFAVQRVMTEGTRAESVAIEASDFGVVNGTLQLEMSESAINPTVFSMLDGTLAVTQGAGSLQALTSDNVVVQSFFLTDASNESSGVQSIRVGIRIAGTGALANESYVLEDSFTVRIPQ